MTVRLEIIEAACDTPIDRAILELRYRILRQPLGLDFTEEQLLAEKDEIHLALLIDRTPIGCILLAPQERTTIKFRQMAIDPAYQGRGFGKLLIDRAENIARSRGYQKIVLHARETAIEFYLKVGYQKIGMPFIEVTIPHLRMEKNLS
jgi:GNAT superfamily N-acetyltransferase